MSSHQDRSWMLVHPGDSMLNGDEPRMPSEDIERVSEDIFRAVDKPWKARCVLFASSGRVVNVWTSASDSTSRDMLDVSAYFPNGATSARITNIPGTRTRLPRDWRIFVSNGGKNAPVNKSIRRAFNVEWRGNILMAQYSKRHLRDAERMKNIPDSQQDYAALLLGFYAQDLLPMLKGEGEKARSI